MPDTPVTLDQIAAAAGVSKWTVARVLNGETKECWPRVKARADYARQGASADGVGTVAASAQDSRSVEATVSG